MLTVLCGLPASGKTTWRNAHGGEAVVICLDEIREELTGDALCQRFNENVVMVAVGRTKDALEEGKDVIIDATSLTKEFRAKWIRLAEEADQPVRCVYFPMDLETALERNQRRDRQVPEQAIQRMARQLEKATAAEGFEEVIEVR